MLALSEGGEFAGVSLGVAGYRLDFGEGFDAEGGEVVGFELPAEEIDDDGVLLFVDCPAGAVAAVVGDIYGLIAFGGLGEDELGAFWLRVGIVYASRFAGLGGDFRLEEGGALPGTGACSPGTGCLAGPGGDDGEEGQEGEDEGEEGLEGGEDLCSSCFEGFCCIGGFHGREGICWMERQSMVLRKPA